MPKEQRKDRIPRQQPVSCRFCRSRKLRCNRQAPCSNCLSRGIRCELDGFVAASPAAAAPPVAPPTPASPADSNASQSEILERIRKLEQLLESNISQRTIGVEQAPTASASENNHKPSSRSSQLQNFNNDVAWLESVYSKQDPSGKLASDKVFYRTVLIQDLEQSLADAYNPIPATPVGIPPHQCVILPQLHEAKILVEKYAQDIDYIHHVVHIPSLSAVLEDIYSALNGSRQVNLGHIILVLCIFASATYSWLESDCQKRGLFSTPNEANSQSTFWIRAAQDALDIAYRTTFVSIEAIQGTIILGFVLINGEEISLRARSMFALALLMGRDLGLHRLDHPSNAGTAKSAQAEIGRRVWWYLVAADWLAASRFAWASEGTYQCHPRHMMVRKPLNIDDADLYTASPMVEKPMSQPTSMSYSILRIRLAEISRNIVDRNPALLENSTSTSYNDVMDFDTELQTFINDIPSFFCMDESALIETFHLDPAKAKIIKFQGYMIHTMIYGQRCKLHLPYLTRGYTESKYAYSREMCIKTARLIVQNELKQRTSGIYLTTRFWSCGLILGVFMASVVLLMDQCANKVHGSSRPLNWTGEVASAFRIVQDARNFSPTAVKLLDSLTQVLRKHHVSPPKVDSQPRAKPEDGSDGGSVSASATELRPVSATEESQTSWAATASNNPGSSAMNGDSAFDIAKRFTSEDFSLSYFGDLEQDLEQSTQLNNFDWESIFMELNSSFL